MSSLVDVLSFAHGFRLKMLQGWGQYLEKMRKTFQGMKIKNVQKHKESREKIITNNQILRNQSLGRTFQISS